VAAPTALPPAVVGDATGDFELVRGGGGGGIRLFCRSGVRSGTGGLPPASEDVLLRRRNTGLGATGIVGPVTVVGSTVSAATTVVGSVAVTDSTDAAAATDFTDAEVAAAAAAAAGVVWSSSSRVSSAFSAPVGSRFPAPPLPSSVPVPVWSTTLPCPATLP